MGSWWIFSKFTTDWQLITLIVATKNRLEFPLLISVDQIARRNGCFLQNPSADFVCFLAEVPTTKQPILKVTTPDSSRISCVVCSGDASCRDPYARNASHIQACQSSVEGCLKVVTPSGKQRERNKRPATQGHKPWVLNFPQKNRIFRAGWKLQKTTRNQNSTAKKTKKENLYQIWKFA